MRATKTSTFSPANTLSNQALPSPTGTGIGTYAYIGCWVEPSSVRALIGAFYASDNMTLEYCASNCGGIYRYWGVEYGREVKRLSLD